MANPTDNTQARNGLYPNGVPIVNRYEFEAGVACLPVAQDQLNDPNWSPVVVVRLHAPYRIRRVSYEADKVNNPPVVPSPESSGKFVFLGGTMGVTTTLNTTFNNYNWGVRTDYVYVENCRSVVSDGFVLGSPGFSWDSTALNLSQYGAGAPPSGSAAAAAGTAVRVGYAMATTIFTGAGNFASPVYGYNEPSYYPGGFFNPNIVNGIS